MKRFAKLFLAIVAILWVLAVAALLTGCGGGGPDDGPDRGIKPMDCKASGVCA